jgi:ligand-binding SRPBCC domain-containing protein
MALHQLRSTQRIPLSLDEAWAFFSDPRNLPTITPPWLGMTLTSEGPEVMHPGLLLTYRIRPVGPLRLSWVTEITHVVDRKFFVDEQRFGPYRFWHHQHHFRAISGGTEMRDIVSYDVGFGPIGDLANRLTVARRVAGIFAYRKGVLDERFGEWKDEELRLVG